MPFAANAVILEARPQQSLANTSGSVASGGGFSVTADQLQYTNTDRAIAASFVLRVNYTLAPNVSSPIKLYARLMDIVGGVDAEFPSANNEEIYIGSFWPSPITTSQDIPMTMKALPGVNQAQIIEFYIKNETGQAIPAGWIIYITPLALTSV